MKESINKAYLIYDPVDIEKNTWFINHMIECFKQYDVELTLIKDYEYSTITSALFILNRSRNVEIATYFEKLKIPTFNSSLVCLLGNNKYQAYEYLKPFTNNILPYLYNDIIEYPCVLKSLNGHGGSEVFLIDTQETYTKSKNTLNKDFITQQLLKDYGVDVRVYILNNQIYACVKRVSHTSFKSNYSLGGSVSLYTLTSKQQQTLNTILENIHFDFVGIDFLMDQDENFYFNEIEDVVGTRMLYQLSNQDIIKDYAKMVMSKL